LARELRDRYAEMRDVLDDLQRVKEGKPPAAQRQAASRWPAFAVLTSLAGMAVLAAVLAWMLSTKPSPLPPPKPRTPLTTPATNPPTTGNLVLNPTTTNQPATNQPAVIRPVPKAIVFAGQAGVAGYVDGSGEQAQFHLPNDVAVDAKGNLYVADTANNVIRKITPRGIVTTLAGLAGTHGSDDGEGDSARFWAPFGVAVDAAGNVYVADSANNIIREITPRGVVTTLAGLAGHAGSEDGVGSAARFRNPWGVAVDGLGDVYVADMSNDTIRKIAPDGKVTTLAGQAGQSGNADGPAASAQFDNPFAVAVDNDGNVFVADSANDTIRKITEAGQVATVAGLSGYPGYADGNVSTARFFNPQGVAVDSVGNVYVADTGNNTIRKITPAGNVSTLPELAGPGDAAENAASVQLKSPGGVAVDQAGNIYIADTNDHCIRKIAAKTSP